MGGTGFIGGHLAEYFFSQGEISKGVFRKGAHLKILDQCGVQSMEADLLDRHSLHEPLDMVDVVYCLASPPPRRPREEYSRFNQTGLRNLLEEAHEHGAKRFVYLSTLDVYGFGSEKVIGRESTPHPTDDYQRSKLEGESVVVEFGKSHPEMQVRIVRAAKSVGSRDYTVVTPILGMIERGRVVLPPGSSASLSVTHPKDIAQALLKSATSAGDAAICQVKSYDVSIDALAKVLVRESGQSAQVRQQGLLSGKGLIGQYASEEIRAGLTLQEVDSSKRIGYSPAFDLEKVVAEVLAWYRKEPWVTRDLG